MNEIGHSGSFHVRNTPVVQAHFILDKAMAGLSPASRLPCQSHVIIALRFIFITSPASGKSE